MRSNFAAVYEALQTHTRGAVATQAVPLTTVCEYLATVSLNLAELLLARSRHETHMVLSTDHMVSIIRHNVAAVHEAAQTSTRRAVLPS